MSLLWVVVLSGISQLIAAVIALRLIRITNARWAWGLISLGLFLMAFRRAISAYHLIVLSSSIVMDPLQEYVGLVLSLCILAGVVLIKPLFLEIKQSEEKLRESNLKFQIFADYTYDWEYWIAPDGSFVHISPSCESFTGYSASEFYKNPDLLAEIVHPNDQQFACEHLKNLDPGKTHSVDFRIIAKNGEERWFAHVCQPVFDDNGEWLGRRGSNRDITKRIKDGLELEEYRTHLEDLVKQRTEELEAFTYSVSHDLRAPLRSIDGFSQVIMKDYSTKLDKKGLEYLRKVRKASERMALMIDDLLALSRATRVEIAKSKVELSELAEEIVGSLQDVSERQAKITIKKSMTAWTDPVLIRVVLENLLGNAWKFTGGRDVTEINLDCTQAHDEFQFTVKDNGVGFDMRYADDLFAPFQRFHPQDAFPGTGIGLAIVSRVIHRLGGRVWAESKPDKGATFGFSLPKNADRV